MAWKREKENEKGRTEEVKRKNASGKEKRVRKEWPGKEKGKKKGRKMTGLNRRL